MLPNLKRTLARLQASEPSTSLLLKLLSRHCNDFSERLQRIQDCTVPCVKRILAEELLEAVDGIVYLPIENNRWCMLETTALWCRYRDDAASGRVLDLYYLHYVQARQFVYRWLEHSYNSEVFGEDYKTKRYAYALSAGPFLSGSMRIY